MKVAVKKGEDTVTLYFRTVYILSEIGCVLADLCIAAGTLILTVSV